MGAFHAVRDLMINSATSVDTLLIPLVNCRTAHSVGRGIHSMEVDVDFRAQSPGFIIRILPKEGVKNPGL